MRKSNGLAPLTNAEKTKRYRQRHPDKVRAAQRQYDATREHSQRSRRWRLNNPEKRCAYNRKTLDKRCAQQAKRRAAKRQAMPAWANEKSINAVYALAQIMGQDVDHIVPLCSAFVCGLHVETNLRLLDPVENRKKKNVHWPDMFEETSNL